MAKGEQWALKISIQIFLAENFSTLPLIWISMIWSCNLNPYIESNSSLHDFHIPHLNLCWKNSTSGNVIATLCNPRLIDPLLDKIAEEPFPSSNWISIFKKKKKNTKSVELFRLLGFVLYLYLYIYIFIYLYIYIYSPSTYLELWDVFAKSWSRWKCLWIL